MTTSIETADSAPDTAPPVRIPDAVWINRPTPVSDGLGRAAKMFAVAILLGVVAAAARYAATGPLVTGAIAGTEAAAGPGNGPTGYFPDQFDRSRLAPAEPSPTF